MPLRRLVAIALLCLLSRFAPARADMRDDSPVRFPASGSLPSRFPRDQVSAEREAPEPDYVIEILLMTGAFGSADPRKKGELASASHSGTGEYGDNLRKLAAEERCAFLDMTTPWARFLNSTGKHPHVYYRDAVHANERGEQILAGILIKFFHAAAAHQ